MAQVILFHHCLDQMMKNAQWAWSDLGKGHTTGKGSSMPCEQAGNRNLQARFILLRGAAKFNSSLLYIFSYIF